MKRIVIISILAIVLVASAIIGLRAQMAKAKEAAVVREAVIVAANNRMVAATHLMKSQGLEAAADYCAETVLRPISGKTHFVTCSIVADFIDPETYKVIGKRHDVVYPASVVTHVPVEDARDLIRQGYTAKHIMLLASVWDRDPMTVPNPTKIYQEWESYPDQI